MVWRRGSLQKSGSPGVKNFQHPRPTYPLGMHQQVDKVIIHSHHADDAFSKRAKTEDEKEQRRIERVLRNRQAA